MISTDQPLRFIYTPERPRFVKSWFVKEGNNISGHQACLPRIWEPYPDTGEKSPAFIFMAHQSGPYRIAWTPGDPIIQDSLTHEPL